MSGLREQLAGVSCASLSLLMDSGWARAVGNGLWASYQAPDLPHIGRDCPSAHLPFSSQWMLPEALADHCHRGPGV